MSIAELAPLGLDSQKLDTRRRLRVVVETSTSIEGRVLGHVAESDAVESPVRSRLATAEIEMSKKRTK